MKYFFNGLASLLSVLLVLSIMACNNNNAAPSKDLISQIKLKRGNLISCSPGDNHFGVVNFEIAGTEKTKKDFNLAIALLHSFEYDESEKVFAKIIDETPGCAMAYWGVAMCNFHALWTPPAEAELQKGSKAIEIANTLPEKTAREAAYINALATFYSNWKTTDHHSRCLQYEKAMEQLHQTYPADKEAAIFYALALDAAASPADKQFTNQKKAAVILNALYATEPNHPGIIHYIIHTYDYPGLAQLALPFAKKYAVVAPSSAHALHMPSHIFTRLGLWDECIQSNLVSVASAKCYAKQAGIKGHWDEELHGLDYLEYAYLQKGENDLAEEQVKYTDSIKEVYLVNFKVAYAFAAIPARFYLENKNWKQAATVPLHAANFEWDKFPWQESIIHFCRLLGNVHLGNTKEADTELAKLYQLYDVLEKQKDTYKSGQVLIQIKAGEAWIKLAAKKNTAALQEISLAADMEDSTEKHPVTPGEVLPARELAADMLFQLKQYSNALLAYEAVLQKSPNRLNSLYGAGSAAEKSGHQQKAVFYYRQLAAITAGTNSQRPELPAIRKLLASQKQ